MRINRVAITGADQSVRPQDLKILTKQFPFVEWAILLSQSDKARYRYPTQEWLEELWSAAKECALPMAGHLCGSWVRNLIEGKANVFDEHPEFLEMFPRIQLNFGSYHVDQFFLHSLKPYQNQFIFQVGVKEKEEKEILLRSGLNMGLNLAVLFDQSEGKGLSPVEWPQVIDQFYCGYAGGLGPNSLAEQLSKIADAVGNKTIWIDMESKVRSNDDMSLDLEKVKLCLEIASSWVI